MKAMSQHASLIFLLGGVPVSAQIVSYQPTSLPQDATPPWTVVQQPYMGDNWLADGWLFQHCDMVTSQYGEDDFFYRDLPEMAGLPKWFLEWRMFTDGPPAFASVAPASIVAGSFTGVTYHFVIGNNRVRFLRDTQLPLVYADIQPGVPHTYRLELLGAQSYTWYIDGQVIDTGVPEGQYPVSSSRITFGDRASSGVANTTQWSYVRYGRTPVDHSGDFDSNGVVDQTDLLYFVGCLLAPDYDSAGPSCRWADLNVDNKTDASDIQLFIRAMLGA